MIEGKNEAVKAAYDPKNFNGLTFEEAMVPYELPEKGIVGLYNGSGLFLRCIGQKCESGTDVHTATYEVREEVRKNPEAKEVDCLWVGSGVFIS